MLSGTGEREQSSNKCGVENLPHHEIVCVRDSVCLHWPGWNLCENKRYSCWDVGFTLLVHKGEKMRKKTERRRLKFITYGQRLGSSKNKWEEGLL